MTNEKDYTISVSRKEVEEKKRVSFDSNVKILKMYVWSFAYHESRKNDWKTIAADRYRFDLRRKKFEAMLRKINFFSRQ